ncbi:uncharacterized protein LOC136040590 [Artemia franciscana]|uniref:Uncharacterized protein n=1 Tax=Artemia franciscana TaxID=6661 RepID=A0AA88HTK2_ARTSF|nr:hypothetical protein QYM36_009427 [Artemia franciscana]
MSGLVSRNGASSSGTTAIRRTERIRRERPNFYDASEFISEKKLRRQIQDQEDKEFKPVQKSPQKSKKKRGRKPKNEAPPPPPGPNPGEICVGPFGKIYPIDDEPLPELTEEKQWQFSVILEDLSRKLISNNPKF